MPPAQISPQSGLQPAQQPQAQQPPFPGNWNPFAATQTGAASRPHLGHIREESRDFIYGNGVGGTGMNGGRHSPDAFSGLSARFR